MQNKTLLLVISGLIILLIIAGICTAESTMPVTVKTNSSAPYDDGKFKNLTYPVIIGLTGTKLTSEEQMNLQSVYYEAAMMKVSKDFYPVALNVTKLLYYLGASNEAYDELDDNTGLGAFNGTLRSEQLSQAKADNAAAEKAWWGLVTIFPNSTLYKK